MIGSGPIWLPAATAGISVILFAWAAWSDLAVRRIPDRACLGILLVGLAQRAVHGIEALGISVLAAGALLGVLVVLHARSLIGGGDVKLIAAAAVGVPASEVLRFLVAVAFCGGALAVALLLLRHRLSPRAVAPVRGSALRRVLAAERWRIGRRASMPYGVAIAGGGTWMILAGLAG